MRARVFDPTAEPAERAFGSVLAADAPGHDGHTALRKGTRLGFADHSVLAALDGPPLHLVDLDAGELEHDEVARRLAAAVAGPRTRAEEPAQGQGSAELDLGMSEALPRFIPRTQEVDLSAVHQAPRIGQCFRMTTGDASITDVYGDVRHSGELPPFGGLVVVAATGAATKAYRVL